MNAEGMAAGVVARRLGVAVTTLRTWHQRYGLGPSLHEPGQHRRYTEDDLARLELMQRLVSDGVSPAEAARWAGRTAPQGSSGVPKTGVTPRHGGHDHRDGGGVPLRGADPVARGLSRAALRLDVASVQERITTAIGTLGVVDAWNQIICPVLVAVGERHAASGTLNEVEHLLSRCVSAALAQAPRPRAGSARTLLACADEEQHSLPIEALDAALAERGAASRTLGARVPTDALLAAVRRTGPAAVLLWSQQRATAGVGQLVAVLRERPRPLLVAACGPGWDQGSLPDSVVTPQTLTGAVSTLEMIE